MYNWRNLKKCNTFIIQHKINQSVSQPVNQSVDQSINQLIKILINQSISHLVNQWVSQRVNVSVNQLVSHNQSSNWKCTEYFSHNYNIIHEIKLSAHQSKMYNHEAVMCTFLTRLPFVIWVTRLWSSYSIYQEMSFTCSQWVSKLVIELVSRSVNQPVSKSVSQSVSQSVSKPVSQSVSQSVNQSVIQSVSQSTKSTRKVLKGAVIVHHLFHFTYLSRTPI